MNCSLRDKLYPISGAAYFFKSFQAMVTSPSASFRTTLNATSTSGLRALPTEPVGASGENTRLP